MARSTTTPQLRFGHSPKTLRFWRDLVKRALGRAETPFYLFSIEPVHAALKELEIIQRHMPLPVRHWLSLKTQPVRPLVQWWCRQGGSVEVVSEFELLAALQEGFLPERILLNGPAKHTWLPRHAGMGLNVNFDSITEARVLLPLAKKLRWRVGIRLLTSEEFDPENPNLPTQFGLSPAEAAVVAKECRRQGVEIETVHFHLRTNVASPVIYERAIKEVADLCRALRVTPKFLDCGGGLPPPHVLSRVGQRYDEQFDLSKFAQMLARAVKQFPSLQELWLENGRFVSARAGVLVMRVCDVKERRGLRQLICDGGRTTHALVSNWEAHELVTLPRRVGAKVTTAAYGPTCMAFDQLAQRTLPKSIRTGDCLVWMDAGAYHIPWETRFSHGIAPVLWHEGKRLRWVRARESFADWWGQWH